MGLSTILFLISIIILAIYSYVLLALNENIVTVDLLFFNLDIGLGQIILLSTLIGIYRACNNTNAIQTLKPILNVLME